MADAPVIPLPAPAAKPVTGDGLADSLLALPPPGSSEHSVNSPAETARLASPGASPQGDPPRDLLGRPFDGAKFRTGPDGKPFLNRVGHFMPRGGRKPGVPNAGRPGTAPGTPATERKSYLPPPPIPFPTPQTPAEGQEPGAVGEEKGEPAAPRAAYAQTAEAYLRLSYATAGGFLDAPGEWQPDDAAEHQGLKEPLAEYLAESGAQPLPPWARLAVAALSYILKRVARPKTKSALLFFWRKASGRKEPAAPVNPTERPATARPAAPVNDLEILPFGAR